MALRGKRGHTVERRAGLRAAAVRVPAASRALVRAREEMARVVAEGEVLERRGVVRGLIVLGVVVLVGSMVRAGWERVFGVGWWWL